MSMGLLLNCPVLDAYTSEESLAVNIVGGSTTHSTASQNISAMLTAHDSQSLETIARPGGGLPGD